MLKKKKKNFPKESLELNLLKHLDMYFFFDELKVVRNFKVLQSSDLKKCRKEQFATNFHILKNLSKFGENNSFREIFITFQDSFEKQIGSDFHQFDQYFMNIPHQSISTNFFSRCFKRGMSKIIFLTSKFGYLSFFQPHP